MTEHRCVAHLYVSYKNGSWDTNHGCGARTIVQEYGSSIRLDLLIHTLINSAQADACANKKFGTHEPLQSIINLTKLTPTHNSPLKIDDSRLTKNNYQLISRILFLNYHLSGPGITTGILLPTLQHRADSPQSLVYVALQHARFTHNAYYYALS